MNNILSRTVICLALILFAVLSFFPLAARFSAPERYTEYTASIDAKTDTVLKLMAASTVTSAGIRPSRGTRPPRSRKSWRIFRNTFC